MTNQDKTIQQTFALAKERYAGLGVDVDAALRRLAAVPISMQCWQGDDVGGFENLGSELGGRPRGDAYYDAAGHVLYDKVVDSHGFQKGLARLEEGLRQYVVAALCAEEDPAGCHRRLLVGRVLGERGIAVDHIRGDGRLQSEAELAAAEPHSNQLSLFEEIEAPWKSVPSVSPKKRQSSSSRF